MPVIDPRLDGFTQFLRMRMRSLGAREFRDLASRFLGNEVGYEDVCDVVLAELVRRTFNRNRNHPYVLQKILDELTIECTPDDVKHIEWMLTNESEMDAATIFFDEEHLSTIKLSDQGYIKGVSILERLLASGTNLALASDRVVPLDHNSAKHSDLIQALRELRKRIKTGNELTDLTPEEIEIAASEVYQLEIAVSGYSIHLEDFLSRARRTLGWISDKSGGAMVGLLTVAAVEAIEAYFEVSLF